MTGERDFPGVSAAIDRIAVALESFDERLEYKPTDDVATLQATLRANLSEKFMPLDNDDLAEALLPVLLSRNLDVVSCDATPTKLYIKAVDKKLFRDVPIGYNDGNAIDRRWRIRRSERRCWRNIQSRRDSRVIDCIAL